MATPDTGAPIGAEERVDLGVAVLVPAGGRAGGWTLLIDGVPQSFVDPADPTYLEFEYVRRIGHVVDFAAPKGQPLRVLHLGGGALTLPRYVAATRPGSVQCVVERDTALIKLVNRWLPVAEGAGIEVVTGDARAAVEQAADRSYDLVIGDVYRAAQMPAAIASTQFAGQLARVLDRDGLYVVNIADLPPLAFSRRQVATLLTVFPDVCVIAEPGMLRGRRYGNVVLAAALTPGRLPVDRLAARAYRDPFPGRVVHGPALEALVAGARAVDDASAEDSPAPPRGRLMPMDSPRAETLRPTPRGSA